MGWFYVVWASLVEVVWVLGLRYSTTWLHWAGTLIAIVFSFYFIIKACEKLPSGTVYAVFTGAGAAMIVTIDFLAFDAEFSYLKLLFIGLIMLGVIGLKMTTDESGGSPGEASKAAPDRASGLPGETSGSSVEASGSSVETADAAPDRAAGSVSELSVRLAPGKGERR